MIAIAAVAMVGLSAKAVIHIMRRNDQGDAAHNHPKGMTRNHFFPNKQADARGKKQYGQVFVVMQPKAMPERQQTNQKGQTDHQIFHGFIGNQIYTPQRKTGKKKRNDCAMNGTGQRSGYPEAVPIDAWYHN
jgi:hypothetical protein